MLHTHVMDAGLAAVIAGAAGAGGAALAAFGTSLGLLKQAKLQGNQAHRSWLRDHQQQAYEEFLALAETIQAISRDATEVIHPSSNDPLPNEQQEQLNSFLEEIFTHNRAITTSVQRLALLADNETSNFAFELVQSMIEVVKILNDSRMGESPNSNPPIEGRIEVAESVVYEKQAQFINHARNSLQQA